MKILVIHFYCFGRQSENVTCTRWATHTHTQQIIGSSDLCNVVNCKSLSDAQQIMPHLSGDKNDLEHFYNF